MTPHSKQHYNPSTWILLTETSFISTKLILSPFISYTFLCYFTAMYIQYLSFCLSTHYFDLIFAFLLFFLHSSACYVQEQENCFVFSNAVFAPFPFREDHVTKLFFIIVFILALYTILLLEFYHCCVEVDFLFGTWLQQILYYDNERLRGPLVFKITLKAYKRFPPSVLKKFTRF